MLGNVLPLVMGILGECWSISTPFLQHAVVDYVERHNGGGSLGQCGNTRCARATGDQSIFPLMAFGNGAHALPALSTLLPLRNSKLLPLPTTVWKLSTTLQPSPDGPEWFMNFWSRKGL